MTKAFEKQVRTIEDQGERQIKAIQDQGQVKTIKKFTYDDKDTPLILKQKEIFNKLVDERLEEITNLDKKKLIAMIWYTDTKVILQMKNFISLIMFLVF